MNTDQTTMTTQSDTTRIPRSAYDTEYKTEWLKEVRYLEERGIHYTYVKRTPEYGIRQYKYKKTPELFAALLDFYTQVRYQREFNTYSRKHDEAKAVS